MKKVLSQQPAEILDFLFATSILERLCGTLCDAVTGARDGQDRLEALEALNLFIVPLDDQRAWYRYHHLFHSLLRRRAERQYAADQHRVWHQRACDWLAARGWIDEALAQALAAEDRRRTVALIEQHAEPRLWAGDVGTVMAWFDRLPTEWLEGQPRLAIGRALALFLGFRWSALAEALAAAKACVPDDDRALAGVVSSLASFVATAGARPTEAIALARLALTQLPEDDRDLRGLVAGNLGVALMTSDAFDDGRRVLQDAQSWNWSVGNLLPWVYGAFMDGQISYIRGHLGSAIERHRRAQVQIVERAGASSPLCSMAQIGQALVHLEWGEVAVAEQLTQEAMALDAGMSPIAQVWALVALAAVERARGDVAAATAVVDRLEATLARAMVGAWEQMTESHRARIWCVGLRRATDPHASVRLAGWLNENGWLADCTAVDMLLPDYPKETAATCAVRWWLAQGDVARAQKLLADLRSVADARGWYRARIEIALLEAQAQAADDEASRAALRRGLTLAAAEGFVQVVVEEAPWITDRLRDEGAQLLADFPGDFGAKVSAALGLEVSAAEVAGHAATLSRREREILAAIAEGWTNREVGDRLHIRRQHGEETSREYLRQARDPQPCGCHRAGSSVGLVGYATARRIGRRIRRMANVPVAQGHLRWCRASPRPAHRRSGRR